MSETVLVVLVKYKAQPGKAAHAIAALKSLIQKVAQEPHYISIKLVVDPSDETNILLCEEWSSEAYYKTDHMNTAHLQQFMGEARAFLAGPPDISFWAPSN
jgi:quinol monooxygenase YgiN